MIEQGLLQNKEMSKLRKEKIIKSLKVSGGIKK